MTRPLRATASTRDFLRSTTYEGSYLDRTSSAVSVAFFSQVSSMPYSFATYAPSASALMAPVNAKIFKAFLLELKTIRQPNSQKPTDENDRNRKREENCKG